MENKKTTASQCSSCTLLRTVVIVRCFQYHKKGDDTGPDSSTKHNIIMRSLEYNHADIGIEIKYLYKSMDKNIAYNGQRATFLPISI